MTHPSWVALHSMAHSFIELDKAVIRLISSVIGVFILSGCGFLVVHLDADQSSDGFVSVPPGPHLTS